MTELTQWVSDTNANIISTSTGGSFMVMDIKRTEEFPGAPERPKNLLGWMLGKGTAFRGTQAELDQKAIGMQVNPRPYFKWMRCVIRQAWAFVRYLPPGTSIPIMRDRQGPDYRDIAAWGLFLATPENRDVVFTAHSIRDDSVIKLDENGFMRFRDGMTMRTIAMCMNRPFHIVDPEDAETVETWNMRDGSIIYDTGNKWYSLTNTGTTPAVVVSLHSFNVMDLEPLLLSPYTNSTSKWRLTWQ